MFVLSRKEGVKTVKKRMCDCVKGGVAGLTVGVAIAALTTGKGTAGLCLKKNMKRMVKAAGGVLDSLKRMMG